jgi:hypothetical protein
MNNEKDNFGTPESVADNNAAPPGGDSFSVEEAETDEREELARQIEVETGAPHAVSTYGCSFFHCRMSQREADIRSIRDLHAIAREWEVGGLYARIWTLMHTSGLVASSPIETRARLRKALASR